MDEAPDSREQSFCKPKGGQQDEQIVARGYITEVVILTLTYLFSVPKETDDIPMVFDATASGLNDSLWSPNFMLPSMVIALMMVGPEMHMVDIDVGGGVL